MNKNNQSWFRKRGYLHFDSPVSIQRAESIVKSPDRVSKHSFYPLINYDVDSFKVFKNSDGLIEKKEKKRPIAYASHVDSHIYAYYAWLLNELYEQKLQELGLSENVLAFRTLGRSNIEFADAAFENIKQRKYCSVVALDVKGFFDNLNHKMLKRSWADLIGKQQLPKDHFNVFKSLTRYSTVSKDELYKALGIAYSNPKNGRYRVCEAKVFREKVRGGGLIATNKEDRGIPQGAPISALLSNIYMIEFDRLAKEVMEEQGGSYYRYCDDMLFITSFEYQDDIESFAQAEIQKLCLSINADKTEKRRFWIADGIQTCDKPLQYLGFTFDGQRKLLRSAALARFSNKMKRGVKFAKLTQEKRNAIKREKGIPETGLYRNQLYMLYSHLGRRNFLSYSYRAAKHMKSDAIRKQVKPLWTRLQKEIEE